MREKIICLSSILLMLCGCNGQPSEGPLPSREESAEASISLEDLYSGQYMNPLLPITQNGGYYNGEFADPTVVRGDDGRVYAFGTSLVTAVSEDGCEFEYTGMLNGFNGTPQWWKDYYPEAQKLTVYCWAPDVIKIGDTWIYYYSLATTQYAIGIGYATADSIEGPWEDQGKLFTRSEIGIDNCIDSQVIVDEDGVHLVCGSFRGCFVFDLDDDGMGIKNGVEYARQHKVCVAGHAGLADGSTYEGSYIFKEGDYYYYMGSQGSCCEGKRSTYKVYVGRSESIYGPYVDKKGFSMDKTGSGHTWGELVLTGPLAMEEIIAGPGHHSILKDDAGEYWIYYHCYSYLDNFATRHLFMDKILWDDDGFPYVEGKRPTIEEIIDGPAFR